MNYKFLLKMAVLQIKEFATYWKNKDKNTTGADDLTGISLSYAAEIIEAVLLNKEIPKSPKALR